MGHIVSSTGIKPDPNLTAAIKDFPTPTNFAHSWALQTNWHHSYEVLLKWLTTLENWIYLETHFFSTIVVSQSFIIFIYLIIFVQSFIYGIFFLSMVSLTNHTLYISNHKIGSHLIFTTIGSTRYFAIHSTEFQEFFKTYWQTCIYFTSHSYRFQVFFETLWYNFHKPCPGVLAHLCDILTWSQYGVPRVVLCAQQSQLNQNTLPGPVKELLACLHLHISTIYNWALLPLFLSRTQVVENVAQYFN